jgi:hypothetical protein
MARIWHRGATIAAATTAVVLGGSGIALAATTHDVTGPGTGTAAPVTTLTTTVTTTANGLAPRPVAQLAPAPVRNGVTTVVKTVTTTVGSITSPTQSPPTEAPPAAPAPVPQKAHKTSKQADAPQPVRAVRAAVTENTHAVSWHPPSRANEALPDLQAQDGAYVQRTEPAVTPQLAPSVTGPLADVPGPLQDAIPLALIIIATVIIGALAVGHLGLWWRRHPEGVA